MQGGFDAATVDDRLPVTVLTGWLGAGKTTLVNRILAEPQGRRWAVLVNEFGEIGIDGELVVGAADELVEMNNGCICCTVRGDLVRALHALLDTLAERPGRFDAVLIETTGLADPGPVVQTFFADARLAARLRLDSVTTLVDAVHAVRTFDAQPESVAQVAFADQVVVNKAGAVPAAALAALDARLAAVNPLARRVHAERARVDLAALLGRGGFELARLDLPVRAAPDAPGHVHGPGCGHAPGADEPAGGAGRLPVAHPDHDPDHGHDNHGDFHPPGCAAGPAAAGPLVAAAHHGVGSVSLQLDRALDAGRLQAWLEALLDAEGDRIFRAKGIVAVAGDDRRLVFQAVHRLLEGDWQRAWRAAEPRVSRAVFIGRGLDGDALRAGFEGCAA